LDENNRAPLHTATAKAVHVHGSVSSIKSPTGRSRRLRSSRRRSTMVIEPTTRAMASTCTLSMPGNSQEDSLMAIAGAVDSSQFRKRSNTA
jgi:hypothetical protein